MNLRDELASRRAEYEEHVRDRRVNADTFRLSDEILDLERAIAKEEGSIYLEEIVIPVDRDSFQDCPIVISDCSNCILFLNTKSKQFALVEFARIGGYRVLALGDDDSENHPLAGKGLRPYGIFEVKNSTWCDEINAIRERRVMHPPSTRRIVGSHHYFIYFKARTFEVLAESFNLLGTLATKEQAFARMLGAIGAV